MVDFKGSQFEKSIILQCVRWYLRYPISYRQLEEMMEERGIKVDHSSINRWVLKFTPQLETQYRKRKKPTSDSWRCDEMCIKIKGQWKWLYRAVDTDGDTVEFLLSAKRDKKAALRFFKKAIRQCGTPRVINIDKSGANKAGIEALNEAYELAIEVRQVKYLNNIVEQSHRLIRRMTRPMMGFKNFWSAATTISGIEMVHMLYRDQIEIPGQTPQERFMALAA